MRCVQLSVRGNILMMSSSLLKMQGALMSFTVKSIMACFNRHHHLLQRGITRTLTQAINRTFNLASLMQRIPNADKAIFSVHCHNDLGMAVANSLCPASSAENSTSSVYCRARLTARTAYSITCSGSIFNFICISLNIPDTVGYSIPSEFGATIASLMQRIPNADSRINHSL
jgi:hypothetical protein